MAYNNKETLKDVKGNPIPQYYDPKDDTYKPLDGPITVQDDPTYLEPRVSAVETKANNNATSLTEVC
jgi:hypothetical protein